ncbi:hypothetical protein, partial [Oricola sp.]|uniref:hypothetical protein n=1 Tax=Oricola sp. TaxID=1979950 RepID=UPI002600B407
LFFRETLPLHLSVLQSRPDSNSKWRKNSVAGQYVSCIYNSFLNYFYPIFFGLLSLYIFAAAVSGYISYKRFEAQNKSEIHESERVEFVGTKASSNHDGSTNSYSESPASIWRFGENSAWHPLNGYQYPAYGVCDEGLHNASCIGLVCLGHELYFLLSGSGGQMVGDAEYHVTIDNDEYLIIVEPSDLSGFSYEARSRESVNAKFIDGLEIGERVEVRTPEKTFIAPLNDSGSNIAKLKDMCGNPSKEPEQSIPDETGHEVGGNDLQKAKRFSEIHFVPFENSWESLIYRGYTGYAVCDVNVGKHICIGLFCYRAHIHLGVIASPPLLDKGDLMELYQGGVSQRFTAQFAEYENPASPFFVSAERVNKSAINALKEGKEFDVTFGEILVNAGLLGSRIAITELQRICPSYDQ